LLLGAAVQHALQGTDLVQAVGGLRLTRKSDPKISR
jgi:hypothetical protein